MIPGHPYAGGRLGTKKDVQDLIGYMSDLSAEVKKAADAGKCADQAMKEVKLPKYEKWATTKRSSHECRALLLLLESRLLIAGALGRVGPSWPGFTRASR
jgi:hypothetical protein